MARYLAAIDAGTGGCRTIIFDENGAEIALAYREYSIFQPSPTGVEQNADEWWTAVCRTSREAIKKSRINTKDIAGISVTNQRETIVPVDKKGAPLRNAIVWQDRRAVGECDWLRSNVSADTIYRTTGLAIDPYFSLPKIMWVRKHERKTFDRAHKFLLVHDFIIHKLCGEFATDWSNASRTMLFDINKFAWSEKISELTKMPLEKMPDAKPSGTFAGEILKQSARVTGFAGGTPVIIGGGDQQCAALGVGVVEKGQVKATTGTGTFILAHLEKPLREPKRRLLCSCHVVPKKWVFEASIFTTGVVYRWFRDNLAQGEIREAKMRGIDTYELINKLVQSAPIGSNGLLLLPHFVGAGAPYWNPDARGVLFGLTLKHRREDIARAIVEGVCFEISKNLEIMEQLGIKIDELRITGGATRSPVWNQIQADVYGKPVVRGTSGEATALGAAMLAGLGSGIHRDVKEACKNMLKVERRWVPDKNAHKKYSRMLVLHKKLYDTIEPMYEKIAEWA